MNKTIYLKNEDGPIWDRARELSRGKLSVIVMEAVKKYVAKTEAKICKTCGYTTRGK